jgi:penicillin-binding protein 1C
MRKLLLILLILLATLFHGGEFIVDPADGHRNPSCPSLAKGGWGDFTWLCSSIFSISSAHALPPYPEVRKAYVKSDSLLLDRHGEIIHELRADFKQRRLDWMPLKDISPALKEAVVAAEDRRFYAHSGIDYQALGAALFQGLTSSGMRGASTISMQLAALLDKGLQPEKGRKSIRQKAKQALAAWKLERAWSKDEILETYLNLVTFRGELQGISAASRGLFGKAPHGLDRSESLLLASLIRSPGASYADLAKRAHHLVESLKWPVDPAEITSRGSQVFLGPNLHRPQTALAPHLARQLLKDQPPGTSLSCTLDGEVQRFALDRLVHHLLPLRSQNVGNGAVLVVENRTGEVLAYVSYSSNLVLSGFVDGVKAKRQAGSTLKPFLYGLAMDRRLLTPASLLDDSPLDVPVFNGIYHPRNYESQFLGLVPVRIALASSLNIPAVRAISLVGQEDFLNKLRALGIRDLNEAGDFYGPALALGSADVSLLELVNAYRVLANGGEWSELRFASRGETNSSRKRVLSREAAFLVSDILSDREARSPTFGLENPLATRFWTAVKTGTSKDMRDNWCIGYSHKYTVGVWVGNFTGQPMWNVSGISGAAPVWVEVMNRLHRNEGNPRKELPPRLVKAHIEFPQGVHPPREEWFIRGTEPSLLGTKSPSPHQRILYPPPGSIFALDPDIPGDLQKVFFILQAPQQGVTWVLNGQPLPSLGKATPWSPEAGKFHLALRDEEGRIIDSVLFEVRGSNMEGYSEDSKTPGLREKLFQKGGRYEKGKIRDHGRPLNVDPFDGLFLAGRQEGHSGDRIQRCLFHPGPLPVHPAGHHPAWLHGLGFPADPEPGYGRAHPRVGPVLEGH